MWLGNSAISGSRQGSRGSWIIRRLDGGIPSSRLLPLDSTLSLKPPFWSLHGVQSRPVATVLPRARGVKDFVQPFPVFRI